MKKSFSNGLCQLLFPVLIATASLLTTACNKDNEIVSPPAKDYSAIDDAIIQKYFADSAITVGAICLILDELLRVRRSK